MAVGRGLKNVQSGEKWMRFGTRFRVSHELFNQWERLLIQRGIALDDTLPGPGRRNRLARSGDGHVLVLPVALPNGWKHGEVACEAGYYIDLLYGRRRDEPLGLQIQAILLENGASVLAPMRAIGEARMECE